jgi:hypothetical protein
MTKLPLAFDRVYNLENLTPGRIIPILLRVIGSSRQINSIKTLGISGKINPSPKHFCNSF